MGKIKRNKENRINLISRLKSIASQIQQIKDNADFDTAIAEASGASAEALFKLRLEAASNCKQFSLYLNMQQVSNNKEATKEQKRRIC